MARHLAKPIRGACVMAFRLTDADDYSRMAELDAMKLRWREKNRLGKAQA